jgi:hypothetical protein
MMKFPITKYVRTSAAAAGVVAALGFAGSASGAVFYSSEVASGVTRTGVASLNTTLNSTSSLTHTATFDFGLTSARGTTYAGSTGANNVTPFFQGNIASVPITGLSCATTYHWAVVVAGVPDNDQTFTTSACLAPAITVAPSVNPFGIVPVGVSSAQTFIVANPGTANLVVSGITVGGSNPGVFALTLGTCSSFTPTVAPGANCTVVITFSPVATGSTLATLHVASNAGATVNVALSGRGAPNGTVPTLTEWGTMFLAAAFAVVLVLRARNQATGTPA